MTYKYKISWLLIITLNFCIDIISIAQSVNQDSVTLQQMQIVNVAFGSQPSKEVTNAVSTVKGSKSSKIFTLNLANTLIGRLPGLTVSQSTGEPGYDSPALNSRGLSTFGTGNNLYVVVDGFRGTFEQLTPDEIESVTLLKDASATAIYGNRGANGVLLVTTKRGSKGPLQVNFGLQQGFQTADRLPDFLASYDYARLYNEGLINDGKAPLYTENDLEAYRLKNNLLLYPDVNWYDQVLRKMTPIGNYNLNFSGGDNTVRYFGLLNIMTDGGLYIRTGDLSDFSKNSNYSRYNFRTNIDLNLSKRLSVSVILSGSVEDKSNPGVYENTDNEFNLMASIPPNAFPVYVPGGSFGGNSLYSNPLGDILNTGYCTSNSRTATAAVKMTEQLDWITQGLSISAAVSFNNYFRTYSYKTRQYERFAVTHDTVGDTILTKIGQNTSLSGDESRSNQWRNYSVQGFLNYNRTFGHHKFDFMMITEFHGKFPYVKKSKICSSCKLYIQIV